VRLVRRKETMASYLYASLKRIVIGEEDDDPGCLKDPVTMALYEDPLKGLGLKQTALPWDMRDALRSNCLNLVAQSSLNRRDKPILPHKYALIAYHLATKTVKVKRAQDLRKLLDEEPHLFTGAPTDMLQILRPVHCAGVPTNSRVRAGALLHVVYDDYVLCQDPGDALPHQQYVCKVSYCGRQHFVRRRFSEFKELHARLQKELLVVPGFPAPDLTYKVGLGDYSHRGKALCRYACRVHASLGARGMFSPRLLAFLEIDAARVHIEEDGRVSKMLDSTAQVSGSCWHMVDEFWLKRWRKFILGRAARRYEPPGPITNERLLKTSERTRVDLVHAMTLDERRKHAAELEQRATTVLPPIRREALVEFDARSAAIGKYGVFDEDTKEDPQDKEEATIGKHYRAVNYDLWTYWRMVHGGGPCISRKTKEITSVPACGAGQEAISRLQRFGRVCISKQKRIAKFWHHLSGTAAGVREVLADAAERRIRDRVDRTLGAARNKRTEGRLRLAARYTQRMWRSKRAYAFNDENVKVMKHAQEIFARADGEVEHASAGAPFVVEEGERIVQVGATEQYEIKFSEADGPSLPVVFKRHACSELTFVHSVRKDMAMKRGRDQLMPDSVLLVVQSYPVSSLAHDQVMHRLRSAKWPVTLRFSRPLTNDDVTPLSCVLQLDRQGELPEDLKLQMLKRLLSQGVGVKKHGSRKAPYETIIYLNETMLFWRVRDALKQQANSKVRKKKKTEEEEEVRGLSLKYDLTKGCGLYDLRYVRVGKISAAFKKYAARAAAPDHCLSLFCSGSKTIDVEVLGDVRTRDAFAWAFDKIIAEARSTRIFVDKAGAPVARSEPKKRLRMILGAH